MVAVGLAHFFKSGFFVQIMPPYLPWHLELVYISGVFEIAGGLGLLIPRTRVAAAWGLVALYIAVFPANIHMAVHNVAIDGQELHPALVWGRLPFQLLFIAWAWWLTRPSAAGKRRTT